MSLVIDLIDLVAKHKSGELRCPATALIWMVTFLVVLLMVFAFRNLLGLLESAIMLQTSTLEINV